MTTRLEKYESRTTWPLLALALLFLVIYALPIIWPDLPGWVRAITEDLTFAIWLVFAADLAARAILSGRWFHYLLTHPIDLVVVAVPALRPLRVLRVFATAHVLLARTGRLSVMRTLPAIVIATALLVVIGALAVLDAERGAPNAEITNFGDAVWWSMVTVTTVGYGDIVPVTVIGRITTAGLMLVGISLIGAVTASVSAWFMSNMNSAESDNAQDDSAIDARLSALEAQIGDIHRVLVDGHSPREHAGTSASRHN
ncbi:MAG: two pore domain potassium channel family protein [Actinophytocola sp.]|nr:two pore domain potassium channel family protein [Actinophytocola sp.]